MQKLFSGCVIKSCMTCDDVVSDNHINSLFAIQKNLAGFFILFSVGVYGKCHISK